MANAEDLVNLKNAVQAHGEWLVSQVLLQGADLTGADLSDTDLSGLILPGAKLACASLAGTDLSGANLSHADLSGADLSNANLAGTNLLMANLSEAVLVQCNLSGADVSGANLSSANLSNSDLSGAKLALATLADADFSQANLTDSDLSGTDLIGFDFSGANLSGVKFSTANLSDSNFVGANLSEADLSSADLSGALLYQSNLSNADLSYATLDGADLTGADLSKADLFYASCLQTNFSGASFSSTVLAKVILDYAIGLESAVHKGPSTLGIDTILASHGNIPEVFLQGAGVPNLLIKSLKATINEISPVQFYSCFISYSTLDQSFADRIYNDLRARGVRCWFAVNDVQAGRKLHEQIDEAIRHHDKLLLVLSQHSMASEWVLTEISKARKREIRDKSRVLFPISVAPFSAIRDWEAFDADTGKDSAREIREYFIPDFSNWKNQDSYEKAFGRLLKDLRATAAGESSAPARV